MSILPHAPQLSRHSLRSMNDQLAVSPVPHGAAYLRSNTGFYESVCRDRWEVVKVRAIIRELELDGWFQVRHKGSLRHYPHLLKPGTVTVPGALGDEVPKPVLGSFVRQASLERRFR